MNQEKLNDWLLSMASDSECRFLEEGKDDKELKEIADKHGIKDYSKDIAILKLLYAFTSTEDNRIVNGNGCSLPLEEAQKSLHTFTGRALNRDHNRKQVWGNLLEAKIEGNQIIVYSTFLKGNFEKEYAMVKDLFSKKLAGVSFEYYGKKVDKGDGTYDLVDTLCAGGAIIIPPVKPAYKQARVVEMSKQEEEFVLELASIQVDKLAFSEDEKRKLEYSRMYVSDVSTMMRMFYEAPCPACQEYGWGSVDSIDFKNNMIDATCMHCSSEYMASMTPSTMTKDNTEENSRKILKVEVKSKKIADEPAKNSSLEDEVEKQKKVMEEQTSMNEEKMKELSSKVQSLEEQLLAKDTEIATLKADAEKAKAEFAKEKEEAIVAALEAEKVKAEKAAKISERRAELTEEFAKDLSDEDILDDVKFENAKLKKENTELKAKAPVTSSKKEDGLETGKKKEKVLSEKDKKLEASAAKVNDFAYGSK